MADVVGPFPSMSELMAWPTEHLTAAADNWNATANRWYEAFTGMWQDSLSVDWQGDAAEKLRTRTSADKTKVSGLVDQLNEAATVARSGASDLEAASSRVRYAVQDAQAAGFDVGEDGSVTDRSAGGSAAERVARQAQAETFAADIRQRSVQLVGLDQQVGGRVTTALGGIRGVSFPEAPIGSGPLPKEPQPRPDPEPFPPYVPKVWAACRARGQDPGKVVRTFYRAPISAGYRSLPAGDSVLSCGIADKYGMLHIQKDHGNKWSQMAGLGWPGAAGTGDTLRITRSARHWPIPSRLSTTEPTTRSSCSRRYTAQTASTVSRLAS